VRLGLVRTHCPVPPQVALIVSITAVSKPGCRLRGASSRGLGWKAQGAHGRLSCIAGIFQYETISCNNCTDSHVICFGYNCE
jgi:hypothetical protein